jgi:cytoskeletal protein CcmA (bactofilin family)
LFNKKARFVTGGKIENALGPNTNCNGIIKSDGNLRLDGVFEGRIETAGNVIIGTSAQVAADVVAHAVQVWGTVKGNITAHGRLEILPGGQVWGDVYANSLSIDGGGVLRGQCAVITGETEPSALALPAAMVPALEEAIPLEAIEQRASVRAAAGAEKEPWDVSPLESMHHAVTHATTGVIMARALFERSAKTR